MAHKTILVHFHDPRRAERLLQAAIPLARTHNAHLIGLCVLPPFIIIPASEGIGTSVTIDEHRQSYKADVAKLKAMFNEAGRAQPLSIEWCETDAGFGTAAGKVIEHGRSADLIVVSQKDDAWAYSTYLEAPDRIAIEAGRPVLLIPNKGSVHIPPKRVSVAWNGSRESARAVFDALPLMAGADVNVLWINPNHDQSAAGDLPGSDLCTALSRHNLRAEATEIHAPDQDAGAAILREARIYGADMIVMGAYGHSRFREFLLGGASHDVLTSMDRPILMSH